VNVGDKLKAILAVIQTDPGNRGLGRDPQANLFNACPEDFARACRCLAEHPAPVLGVVTGFWIPTAKLGETDGPLGAVYLARTLPQLGVNVLVASDPFCRPALQAGLKLCDGGAKVAVVDIPEREDQGRSGGEWWEVRAHTPPAPLPREEGGETKPRPTHVLALERVGPSHTAASILAQPGADERTLQRFLEAVPEADRGRCHTMRGVDITVDLRDAAVLFECGPTDREVVTIGIGDGGNEIGMGKVPWEVIRRNIPRGAVIACRVATDHLIVAGVSNWGAYALAAGVALLRGYAPSENWFDIEKERRILTEMVEQGPLVDGVKGLPSISVDGLEFEEYIEPLRRMAAIVRA
jgi:D-glutamate cyclase